jgi:hypothetical protein
VKFFFLQSSQVPCSFFPLRPKYSPQYPILTLRLCSSLGVKEQVSHPGTNRHNLKKNITGRKGYEIDVLRYKKSEARAATKLMKSSWTIRRVHME